MLDCKYEKQYEYVQNWDYNVSENVVHQINPLIRGLRAPQFHGERGDHLEIDDFLWIIKNGNNKLNSNNKPWNENKPELELDYGYIKATNWNVLSWDTKTFWVATAAPFSAH